MNDLEKTVKNMAVKWIKEVIEEELDKANQRIKERIFYTANCSLDSKVKAKVDGSGSGFLVETYIDEITAGLHID